MNHLVSARIAEPVGRRARPLIARMELAAALAATRLAQRAAAMDVVYPRARAAMLRLAGHLTREIGGPDRPLLDQALRTAFRTADRGRLGARQPNATSVLIAFYGGLLRPLLTLAHLRVEAGDGARWDPFGSEPYGTWRRTHGRGVQDDHRFARPTTLLEPRTQLTILAQRLLATGDIIAIGGDLEPVINEALDGE